MSANSFATPPSLPRSAIVFNPLDFAFFNTFRIFMLFPEVEIAINKSLPLPRASICLEKILSNSKSLEMHVKTEVSLFSEIALNGFLSLLNLPINSAVKCCESEALPPLPQKKIVPSLVIV